jgi:GTP pyrophosphokinase
MTETGEKRNALLLSTELFTSHEKVSQGAVLLDGSENASVRYATCCHPIPGDPVLGYLGHGEGLMVHTASCPNALKQQQRDRERFISVDWSDEPVRQFEAGLLVTALNKKGVLAKVTTNLANSEIDITHVDMGTAARADTTDLRFLISVKDLNQFETALRRLRQLGDVLKAERIRPTN